MVEQIVYKNDYERQALELLKRQTYAHAKRFETRFLIMTGLLQDMNQAFTSVGWENFADIVEPGSQLFVARFLGYPQPGGGTHPPIPREGVLGKVQGG